MRAPHSSPTSSVDCQYLVEPVMLLLRDYICKDDRYLAQRVVDGLYGCQKMRVFADRLQHLIGPELVVAIGDHHFHTLVVDLSKLFADWAKPSLPRLEALDNLPPIPPEQSSAPTSTLLGESQSLPVRIHLPGGPEVFANCSFDPSPATATCGPSPLVPLPPRYAARASDVRSEFGGYGEGREHASSDGRYYESCSSTSSATVRAGSPGITGQNPPRTTIEKREQSKIKHKTTEKERRDRDKELIILHLGPRCPLANTVTQRTNASIPKEPTRKPSANHLQRRDQAKNEKLRHAIAWIDVLETDLIVHKDATQRFYASCTPQESLLAARHRHFALLARLDRPPLPDPDRLAVEALVGRLNPAPALSIDQLASILFQATLQATTLHGPPSMDSIAALAAFVASSPHPPHSPVTDKRRRPACSARRLRSDESLCKAWSAHPSVQVKARRVHRGPLPEPQAWDIERNTWGDEEEERKSEGEWEWEVGGGVDVGVKAEEMQRKRGDGGVGGVRKKAR